MTRSASSVSIVLLILFMEMTVCVTTAFGQENDPLRTLRPGHPRLILTDEGLAKLKKALAAGEDPLLEKCFQDLIKQADADLAKPSLADLLAGGRSMMGTARECVSRTYCLCLAWRLTGQDRYAAAARDNLLAVCEFADWHPAHFFDTGEMCHAVAIGYDWLYSFLDGPSREKIRAGLIRNGMKTGVEAYETHKYGWWMEHRVNMNQVCNGGLLIGSLAVAETDPEYARYLLPRIVKTLPTALACYAPSGAWYEGMTYWEYATRYTVHALACLDTALGNDFGLSKSDGLDKAGMFPVLAVGSTGQAVRIADLWGDGTRMSLPCMLWLAKRYDRPRYAVSEYEYMRQRPADPMHLVWYGGPALAAGARPSPLNATFLGGLMELAVFRGAWSKDATFVSLKAGLNRLNHGHLDQGTFELDASGIRWAHDFGHDNYSLPGYWDEKTDAGQRWTYYRLGSLSHNIITLDGRNQNLDAETRFIFTRTKGPRPCGVVDLTTAYTPEATSVLRGIALVGDAQGVLVQDEVTLAKPCDVSWGMTTGAEIHASGQSAILTQGGKQLTVRILSPASAKFEAESAEQKPPQAQNKGFRRLVIHLPEASGQVRVAVLLTPVGDLSSPQIRGLSDWSSQK